jgi:hypothetical protein
MYVCIYIYIHTYTYIYICIHCYKHRIKHRIRQNKPRVVLKPGRMPPKICTHLDSPYPPQSHEPRAVHHDHKDEMSCHEGKSTVLGQQHTVLREHLEIRSAAANHHWGMLTWGVGEVAPPRAARSRPCTAATARLRGPLAGLTAGKGRRHPGSTPKSTPTRPAAPGASSPCVRVRSPTLHCRLPPLAAAPGFSPPSSSLSC